MSQLEPLRAYNQDTHAVMEDEVGQELKVEGGIDMDEMLCKIEKKFQCPLTHDLMSDPVRVRGEHRSQVFERAEIEKWIRQNGGNYIGPVTTKKIFQPQLIDANDMRVQIEIYREWKRQLMDMVDEKERCKAVQNTPQMSFEEMEHKIDLMNELGAYEIAEALRQRMLWLKDYLFSPEGIETIVSGAVGTAAAGCAFAAGTEPIGDAVCGATAAAGQRKECAAECEARAVACGVTVAAVTKIGLRTIRKKLLHDRKQRKAAEDAYYDRTIKKCESDPKSVEETMEKYEKIKTLMDELDAELRSREEDIIDASRMWWSVVGAGAGGSALFAGATYYAASMAASTSAAGGEVSAATAFLAANPVTCTVVAGAAAVAACGFIVWYIGKRRGWWKKEKTD